MRHPSSMINTYGNLPDVKMSRTKFDLSKTVKMTFDGDLIIPIGKPMEILPGDTVDARVTCLGRLQTPVTPIMDNIYMDMFAIFVPFRLLWSNFVKMMGEQVDPADSTDYSFPVLDNTVAPLSTTGFTEGSLGDYFGLPIKVTSLDNINRLPFEAYYKCYNDWFRDENLQDSLDLDLTDAARAASAYEIQTRNKRRDYFTSCLPWTSKNNTGTAVTLPLGTSAEVYGDLDFDGVYDTNNQVNVLDGIGGNPKVLLADNTYVYGGSGQSGAKQLYADLTNATAATINQVREAFAIQQLYELDARGGTRYIEINKSHFNVSSSDSRLQRSEILAISSTPINIHAVPNTSPIKAASAPLGADINQGDLGGFGTFSDTLQFIKSFEEHGLLLYLINAKGDISYSEGVDKFWTRQDRLDMYWPKLQNLGEEPVYDGEIFADGTSNDAGVFGYQERYASYKFERSEILGAYRSQWTANMDEWHLSEELGSLPTLNSAFIKANSPFDRVVAVPGEHHFKADVRFQQYFTRCMQANAVPGLHRL